MKQPTKTKYRPAKTIAGAYNGIEVIARQTRDVMGNVDYIYQVLESLGILIANEKKDENDNPYFDYSVDFLKASKLKEFLKEDEENGKKK